MPSADQILASLHEVANTCRALAIAWHVYFGLLAAALMYGVRPSRRAAGVLLGAPLVSVSVVAWSWSNPFNGVIFGAVGLLFVHRSLRLDAAPARLASPWLASAGALLFSVGWVYPHFLEGSSWHYLYAAPTGLIPCPTLLAVTGLALVLNGLGSRALLLILGTTGLFYGVTGVVQLGVALDWVLILGASVVMALALAGQPGREDGSIGSIGRTSSTVQRRQWQSGESR